MLKMMDKYLAENTALPLIVMICFLIFVPQLMAEKKETSGLSSYRIETDFVPDSDNNKQIWRQAETFQVIVKDWRGKKSYPELKTIVKSLWSDEYLYFLYLAPFEALTTDNSIGPDKNNDCWGIWKFDVVELFIGDNPDIKKYFEFVLSPIGQYIDIYHNKNLPSEKNYKTKWSSGWDVSTKIDYDSKVWVTEFRIPFENLTTENVKAGKQFRFNIFRCQGSGDDRKYLSMNPTGTAKPIFHVPEKFGILELIGSGVNLPEPIVKIDFENVMENKHLGVSENIKSSQGIAGTKCLSLFDADSKVISIEDKDVLDKLAGVKSLTITGWMRRKIDFDDENYTIPVFMNCPGVFQITFGRWGRIALLMQGEDGRRKQIWCSWVGAIDLIPDDRWVFFAFSYDGTRSGVNSAFYNGYEIYPIKRDGFSPADAGQKEVTPDDHWTGGSVIVGTAGMLKKEPPAAIIIGAANSKGNRKLSGMLDSIKIYASDTDSSAALNRAQVEAVRQADLGEKWINDKIIEKARNELNEKQRLWEIEDELWGNTLNAHQVDILDRVYSDIPPEPMKYTQPRLVPRGGDISFQFAAMHRSRKSVEVKMSVPAIKGLKAKVKIYELRHVPVEANNNGGIRTTISSRPPEIWMEYIIREAPFQIAEVMIESDGFALRENRMHDIMYKGMLVDIAVDKNAEPGLYEGQLRLETGSEKLDVPFKFEVVKTVVDNFPRLHNIFWFKANPKNLTTRSELPELWSDEHWQLIKNSAKTLRDFGQDTISISLMMHNNEMVNFIQTLKKTDGSYEFDFAMFDKWFKTFRDLGFVNLEGSCTFGGHKGGPQLVRALDEKNGEYVEIFNRKSSLDKWFEFVAVFYEHLYRHLQQKGWTKYYVQAICDEPTNMDLYKKAYALTKKMMLDVRTKEACGNGDYSDYIDIQVFNSSLAKSSYQKLAKKRRSEGKGVWFYHCASPYPPYPNRHLDEALSSSRLYPWLAYMFNADGYLFWAANNYRGADPYKSSIGPLPGGVVNPGHPPGDNWMYYPGPDGLRGSMRMIAFREGLLDHTLLTMLAEKDPASADKIMKYIVRSMVDYQKDPQSYHDARKQICDQLD